MTVGKTALVIAGIVGAVTLGALYGPSMMSRLSDRETADQDRTAAVATEPAPAPAVEKARPARSTATREAREFEPKRTVVVSEAQLYERLKPVLNRGANMEIASSGFDTAEQFATVAHAARNTDVPFMVLKHRVLNEKRSLADAIHQAKPAIDAKAEVKSAQAAARADLASLLD